MLLKIFRPTQGPDLNSQLSLKDKQIKLLKERIVALSLSLNARSLQEKELNAVDQILQETKPEDEPTEKDPEEEQNLILVYETTNIQLLEKLKLQESQNQCLVNQVEELKATILDYEQKYEVPENSMASRTSDIFDHEDFSKASSVSTTVSNSPSKEGLGSPASFSAPETSNHEDATSFIQDLFDTINFMDFDESPPNVLNTKASNSTMNSQVTTSTTNEYRKSCDSLLSLNKSAINVASTTPTTLELRKKSSSSMSMRSLTSNSKKKVHQLSMYFAPKDRPSVPSPSDISSPLSFRSSVYLSDESIEEPVTPTQMSCAEFESVTNEYLQPLPLPPMPLSSPKLASIKPKRVERSFSPVFMQVINEN